MSNEPAADTVPFFDWDAIVDDDPIIAELRQIRYAISAEFDFDLERSFLGTRILGWACGNKYADPDNPRAPLKEAELPQLPPDLSKVIPNRQRFIEDVRSSRKWYAKDAPDLEAYNEDGRRRARVLGFPEDAFVISPSDFPPDIDLWEALDRWLEEDDGASTSTAPVDPTRS
jgi:hypothetical protein